MRTSRIHGMSLLSDPMTTNAPGACPTCWFLPTPLQHTRICKRGGSFRSPRLCGVKVAIKPQTLAAPKREEIQ